MGWIPPPSQLSQREFDKRWRAGARTMKELDPSFWKWHKVETAVRWKSNNELEGTLGSAPKLMSIGGNILWREHSMSG